MRIHGFRTEVARCLRKGGTDTHSRYLRSYICRRPWVYRLRRFPRRVPQPLPPPFSLRELSLRVRVLPLLPPSSSSLFSLRERVLPRRLRVLPSFLLSALFWVSDLFLPCPSCRQRSCRCFPARYNAFPRRARVLPAKRMRERARARRVFLLPRGHKLFLPR